MPSVAGLRGAVALALVTQTPSSSYQAFISATLFIIVVTNVVLGGMTAPLVSFLGINNEHDKTLDMSHFNFSEKEAELLQAWEEMSEKWFNFLLIPDTSNKVMMTARTHFKRLKHEEFWRQQQQQAIDGHQLVKTLIVEDHEKDELFTGDDGDTTAYREGQLQVSACSCTLTPSL
jgi:hypothetical protein